MREAYRLNSQKLLWFAREQNVYLSIVFLFKGDEKTNIRKLMVGDIQRDVQKALETALTIE
jgi:hypothetical protein